ncbi:HAD hydrolase-like protein [Salinisphaera sp. LB1]|uniref:HAD hydrolase-like protein n=1 Tax=Salinisphaera sp. LB1 TaxID=2183911 RepID=UPI000D7E8679|nr:HAD hydrolase-like protein [Salinisphaera sp. LB1]AWN17878.1 Phosphoglycolate phosphatase [Salinisphaera sp. LB1]
MHALQDNDTTTGDGETIAGRWFDRSAMRYTTVLFDLDGTLTDPYEGITRCVEYALSCQGIEVADRRHLAGFIGPPLKAAFCEHYGLSDAEAGRAVEDYRVRFGDVGMYENTVYSGIVDVLAQLRASGRQLFVATSKPWFYARQIVAHFGLDGYFGKVYGSELDGKRTEKSVLIAHVLREEGLRPEQTLMIGDRRFDVLGARHNGVPAAAVSYGYGGRQELLDAQPDHLFDSPNDIARCLLAEPAASVHTQQYGGVLR